MVRSRSWLLEFKLWEDCAGVEGTSVSGDLFRELGLVQRLELLVLVVPFLVGKSGARALVVRQVAAGAERKELAIASVALNCPTADWLGGGDDGDSCLVGWGAA